MPAVSQRIKSLARRILGERVYRTLKTIAHSRAVTWFPNTMRSLFDRLPPRLVAFLEYRDPFLKRVSGLIHIGANTGQEREQYARHDLDVVWIEPIPAVFAELKRNLEPFPKQQAFEYLVADKDDEEHVFHIASNHGASSSMLALNLHKEIWPDIDYQESIVLKSTTLATLVEREGLEMSKYQALVVDTQGSELLVLKGASDLLKGFSYIKTEATDFECYTGCCTVAEIEQFLTGHSFRECRRNKFASRKGVGACYDIVFRRLR